jgi:hypothetical protein
LLGLVICLPYSCVAYAGDGAFYLFSAETGALRFGRTCLLRRHKAGAASAMMVVEKPVARDIFGVQAGIV